MGICLRYNLIHLLPSDGARDHIQSAELQLWSQIKHLHSAIFLCITLVKQEHLKLLIKLQNTPNDFYIDPQSLCFTIIAAAAAAGAAVVVVVVK